MNPRLLAAFLCLAAVSTGCIIHEEDDDDCCAPAPAAPGDVRFTWTFGGYRCDDLRDIKGVNITIPGERLANSGRYPCQANGYDGIVLHDFVPGVYSFTLEAVGYDNQVLYTASGSFSVNGNVSVAADLTPVGSPPSYAYVSWLFPANTASSRPSCAQAGIAYVDARVDDSNWKRFNCLEGTHGASIQTPYLEPGAHYLELVAVDAQGRPLYYFGGEFTTQAGAPVSLTSTLWVIGGASIRWEITNGSTALSCAQAGITQVGINFRDVYTGQYVYGIVGDWHGCNDAPVVYEFLRPGRYRVEMQAMGANGAVYRSASNGPIIDVVGHEFRGPQDALAVQLFRQ